MSNKNEINHELNLKFDILHVISGDGLCTYTTSQVWRLRLSSLRY